MIDDVLYSLIKFRFDFALKCKFVWGLLNGGETMLKFGSRTVQLLSST